MKKCWIRRGVATLFISLILLLSSGSKFSSSNQREDLEMFLKCLFLEPGTPYVLYGDKPMCWNDYSELHFFDRYRLQPLYEILCSVLETYHPFNQSIKKGVSFWNMNFRDKPSNFLLKAVKRKNAHWKVDVFLINKTNFLKVVQKHEDLFKQYLPSFSNPEEFCDKCFSSKDLASDVLENNQVLLGILLGFGKHNAELFDRRERLREELKSITKEDPRYEEVKREFYALVDLLKEFSAERDQREPQFFLAASKEERSAFLDECIEYCSLPLFVVDPFSEETKELRESYEKTRREVRQLYRDNPFLEQTLSQLFPNDSDNLSSWTTSG